MLDIARYQFEYENEDPQKISDLYREKIYPIEFRPLIVGGTISNRHIEFQIGACRLWSCSSSTGMKVSYQAVLDRDAHVVYLPQTGRMRFLQGSRLHESEPGSLFFGNLASFDEVVICPQRTHHALSIANATIVDCLTSLLGEAATKPLVFSQLMPLETETGQQLEALLSFLWQYMQHATGGPAQRCHRQLIETVMMIILEKVPHNYTEIIQKTASDAAPLRLRRAIEFVHAHAADTISIVDISKAAGISVRALQLSFQEFKGTTPMAYLKAVRLKNAREDLIRRDGPVTVGQIAAKWGFTHVGRFAQQYRDMYGETPSQTIRRR